MSSSSIALISIIIASFLWSTAGLTAKILLVSFSPISLAFFRFFFASLAVLPLFLMHKPKQLGLFLRETVPIGLFSALNISLFYFGLVYTTANAATIIYTATPLIVAFISHYILNERLNNRKALGILLGFIGVLIILVLPLIESNRIFMGDIRGNMLIVVAATSWALYTLGSRRLIIHKKYSPFAITSVSICTSTVIFFTLLLLFPSPKPLNALWIPTNFVLVMYLALLVTVATYLLYQWAIKHSSAVSASLTNYLQPISGVALNMIFLHEKITPGYIVGSALVFIGLLLATGNTVWATLRRRI